MDTMIAGLTDRSRNRFEDPTMDGKPRQSEAVRRSDLTNRDIETEILVRLARRGYDWTGQRRRPRGAS